jgi:outer membrane protein assembly factor BamB
MSKSLWFWFPVWWIVTVAGLLATLRFFVEQYQLDPAFYTVSFLSAIILTGLLLVVWLWRGPAPRPVKWAGLCVIVVAPLAFVSAFRVEEARVTGSMWPILSWRWAPSSGDALDQHLQGAVNRDVPANVDLGGESPGDWPQYRGPDRAGAIAGKLGPANWAANPPRLLWRQPVGGGHAAFAVAGKALYTIEQRRNQEAITCYDADTGQQFWAFSYPAAFDGGLGDVGPRSTPTVHRGDVFALGATGFLHCLDARSGKKKWGPIHILENNSNIEWGMSSSPLVVDDLVIVAAGVQSDSAAHGTLHAYDRATGDFRWATQTRAQAGYSSPTLATLAGRRQLLFFDGDGVAGYELDDPTRRGQELWRFPLPTHQHIHAAQPLVLPGDRVFLAAGYGTGCAMVQVSEKDGKWTAQKLYANSSLQCKFSTPVALGRFIVGHNNKVLRSIDAATGRKAADGESYDFGQVLTWGDHLLVTGESGELALVALGPEGQLEELGRFQALSDRSWNLPAVADGILYWRNHREMAAFDLRGH